MNITINSKNNSENDNFRKAIYALSWWLRTLFNAFMLPYYALGAVFAFSFLIGASFADVRETVVSFAGLEYSSWVELGHGWKSASLALSAIYVGFQVIFSKPITKLFNDLINPILVKVDLLLTSKQRIFIFLLYILLVVLLILSSMSHEQKPTTELMLTRPTSSVSASITLQNGEILSGNATVTKQDNNYIVRFNN